MAVPVKPAESPELAAVRDALAAKLLEIHDVEAVAPAAALRIALGKPEDGDQALIDRLAALGGEADTLRLAIDGAEAEDKARREAERARARQAAANALRQHIGRTERAIKRAAVLIAELNDCYDEAVRGVKAAFAVNPTLVGNHSILGPRYIARAFGAESIRDAHHRRLEGWAPRDLFVGEFTSRDGRIQGLAEHYGRVIAGLRSQLPPVERAAPKSSSAGAVSSPAADVEAAEGIAVASTLPDTPQRELTETEKLIAEEHKRMGLAS